MENLINYLKFIKISLENIQNIDNLHFVLGNESCDIDSSVSSIILGYFLHLMRDSCTCPIPSDAIVIPIQNVPKENFVYRSDNCYLFKKIGLPLDLLVYRDQLNFEKLISQKNVTTSLVDHHVLSKNDKILECTVIEIFDHRPRDPTFIWDEKKIQIIMQEVGSCSTLIGHKILSTAENVIFMELGFMIYATIVYDTQALSVESGRAKELDHQIIEFLEKKFNFPDDKKSLFDKLWKAHNDISQLTPSQILMKDLKMVEKMPVPGLPMLVEDFLKLEESYTALKKFAEEYDVPVLIVIGLDASNGIKRDVAIYSKVIGNNLTMILLDMLTNSQKYKGYNFSFTEVQTNYNDIICLRQDNIKLSRKQIIPIIKDALKLI